MKISRCYPELISSKENKHSILHDWYFINTATLLVINHNRVAISCDIADEKYAIGQSDLHTSNRNGIFVFFS